MTWDKLEAIIKARTPGPWNDESYDHEWITIYNSLEPTPLCKTDMMSDADAHFIAAMGTLADLMLDVVKAVQSPLFSSEDHKDWKRLQAALAALRTAVEAL